MENRVLDWNQYLDIAAKAVSEGIVMLKNDNAALPLSAEKEVAVFGRIQLHYYKSGTGSGGMVNVSKVTGILDGLLEQNIPINQTLLHAYQKWDEENPFDMGSGWGGEPWSQQEMPLKNSFVQQIAASAETAIVIIGRTAGEEQDNRTEAGSYLLTNLEKEMLIKVRSYFSKMIVLLNVGNIMDMTDIDSSQPDAILYVWQGGMTGGTGTADVLTGKTSPSGKLTDTIAYCVSDYPANRNFGDAIRNYYCEDIYVGYRYFETFAKEKVRYPFGFGLSYTSFDVVTNSVESKNGILSFDITVTNTGTCCGKEVIQIYCSAPQGELGKPARVLCGYEKTKELAPNESQTCTITVVLSDLASYDDSGATENRFCFILEKGDYHFFVGTDVRQAELVYTDTQAENVIVSKHSQALAPVLPFQRIKPVPCANGFVEDSEAVPMSKIDEGRRRLKNLPQEIHFTGDQGLKLSDVLHENCTMQAFLAQLSDNDLSCIIRGEGMGSPKVTAGTAAAFGGVSEALQQFGIPCGCCSDGPSGMRLDCGTKALSLPNGTMIASTFNRALITELFAYMGLEMAVNHVDCLLGPGMNIHRHPLNGRNFEYFSEDPYLTGTIAAAELTGMHQSGVTGTIKHFCGNNQETHRHDLDSVISERALREIYLKGFEIAVKTGAADSIMTTYGSVNGLWTAGNYDLNTQILRNEWGFQGFTMTDWWANINERHQPIDKKNFAAMARSQNDVYMVCADGAENEDNVLASLQNKSLLRSELQRNASNICNFLMHTNAMQRLLGTNTEVTVLHRPTDQTEEDIADITFYPLNQTLTISMENVSTEKGSSYSFALDIQEVGFYEVTITASSEQSELAQIPVTLFSMGTAYGTFTWNGTGGLPVSLQKEVPMFSRFTTLRFYFAQSGLKMHQIHFSRSADNGRPLT